MFVQMNLCEYFLALRVVFYSLTRLKCVHDRKIFEIQVPFLDGADYSFRFQYHIIFINSKFHD